ncbi:MAG TPA: TetR/AcrR family transcriptional regulator [Stellaceae bacterium]|nr:TetR/AcrR family transcriptional regulator [Stellaceae bacterium]
MKGVNTGAARRRPRASRPRQPAATRRNILAAAIAEFAAAGLAGARVDEIARRAGVGKRMLYHYFGNKEALWLTVLEDAYAKIRGEERLLDVGRLAPRDGMRRLVEFSIRYCQDNPDFVALLIGENLNRARHLRRSRRIRDMHVSLLAVIADLLERGARAGVFRRGIDPSELYITIAALGFFYFSNVHTLSAIFGRDLNAVAARRQHQRHAVDVVLGFLRP